MLATLHGRATRDEANRCPNSQPYTREHMKSEQSTSAMEAVSGTNSQHKSEHANLAVTMQAVSVYS